MKEIGEGISKVFNCTGHEMLIAQLYMHTVLNAYSFICTGYSLHFIYLYLKGRKQILKINSFCNAFAEIVFIETKGSYLSVFSPNSGKYGPGNLSQWRKSSGTQMGYSIGLPT